MQLIDTHSHIYLPDFSEDIEEVIDRARERGLSHIIMPNIDVESLGSLHETADNYQEICIPLLGLHPTHVKEGYKEELETIFNRLDSYNYKAIGEIGIDLYWDKTFFIQQQQAFEFQLSIALENNLPVVIHARDSFREIIDIVKQDKYKGLSGIFHAFTGDLDLAHEIIDLGYLLGIGGIVTFKNSHLPEVVKEVDLNHIVLETDSPYLSPVPFRGKRNESAHVYYVAQKLAEIQGKTIQEVAEITTANAQKIFRL